MKSLAFDFGRNWQAFSKAKLDGSRLDDAVHYMRDLIGVESLRGRSFLDIRCGSGLFSLAAAENGAVKVAGFDVNPTSVAVSEDNSIRFRDRLCGLAIPSFRLGSVLDETFLTSLARLTSSIPGAFCTTPVGCGKRYGMPLDAPNKGQGRPLRYGDLQSALDIADLESSLY